MPSHTINLPETNKELEGALTEDEKMAEELRVKALEHLTGAPIQGTEGLVQALLAAADFVEKETQFLKETQRIAAVLEKIDSM